MITKRLNLTFFDSNLTRLNLIKYNLFLNWNLFKNNTSVYTLVKIFNSDFILTIFSKLLDKKQVRKTNSNLKLISSLAPNGKQLLSSRYYYNGLGYKVFVRNNYLFIWVGLTHYTLIKIPSYIKIFAKKRRFFIVGTNILKFNEFLMKIRQIRKIDLYKGKGLTEVKTYKGFIKMKSGKKKQY